MSAPTPARSVGHLWRRNGLIWAALMALLALTLILAYIPMGRLTTVAGIAIAFAKAALVGLLFMELDKASALVRLAALAGFVFLSALFALTLADVISRFAS